MSNEYIDSLGLKIMIDASENGWTIIYADNSTEYGDMTDTIENNFNTALDVLKSHFPDIKENIN